jgi:putative transcriptional regulator
MKDEDFNGIAEGLKDAIAYAKGDTSRGRVVNPIDVKGIRLATRKSQQEFSTTYHIPIGTLRDWEQSRRQPDAPARTLLSLIAADPIKIEELLSEG